MQNEERFKLLHGPYKPPPVGIGDWLECEAHGQLRVRKWSKGIIPWPMGCRGKGRAGSRPTYILCGDLVRAVRRESAEAIKHWWGVSNPTVTKWRKCLETPKYNEGTRRLCGDWMREKITPEIKASAIKIAHLPENAAKAVGTRRENGRLINQKWWTNENRSLLGTVPDPALARQLGCSVEVIVGERRRLQIPACDTFRSSQATHYGTTFSPERLRARRFALNLSQPEIAVRAGLHKAQYSRYEQGTYLRMKPENLARIAEAMQCLVSDLVEAETEAWWTAENEALLGTVPDSELAEQLGCREESVIARRRRLGVPAFGFQQSAEIETYWVWLAPEKLLAKRLQLGLPKRRMAFRAGMHPTQYGRYETGERLRTGREMLSRLAKAAECSVEDLALDELLPNEQMKHGR